MILFTFLLPVLWGLCPGGQHMVTFSHLEGFSIYKIAQEAWFRILAIALEGELKVLEFVSGLPGWLKW